MRDQEIILLGEPLPAGIYLLIIQLAEDQTLAFGRFNHGDALFLPEGEYLYIGSALGKSGSSSLGARLIRHTSRCDPANPHAIRNLLLTHLEAAGIRAKIPKQKRCRWHIDYLLELPEAEITAIIAARTEKPLEQQLAEELDALPETSIIAPGLGASDHPGGTHLFRLSAGPDWYQKAADLMQQNLDPGDGNSKI